MNVLKVITATFNATGPETESITMDGKSVNKVERTLTCDSEEDEAYVHKFVNDDFPAVKITSTNSSGYVFVGWSTTSGATTGTKTYELLETSISEDVIYYAVWAKAGGFWLGTGGADTTYVDESSFKTNDENYLSSVEIMSD